MSTKTATTILAAMAMAIALFFSPIKVNAQSNNAGIDEEVYRIYVEADKHRLTEQGVKLSEQAYELAVKKGDKKAQSLSLCPQIFYHYKRRDTNALRAIIDRIMNVSKHNGQSKYYYFAWSKWIEYTINERNLLLALNEAQKMNQELLASHTSDHYDIMTSYRTLANVYWGRYDYEKAASYYQKALDYQKKYLPKQDASIVYLMLVRYYQRKRDFKRALQLLNEGIAKCSNNRYLGAFYTSKAITCFWLEDKSGFIEAYNKMKVEEGKYGDSKTNSNITLEVMRHLLKGDCRRFASR